MSSVLPSRRTGSRSRLHAVPILALTALTLAGCSAVSPITTARPYSPSDGIRVTLGTSFTAENLLVVSAAQGEPGSLVGGLTNRGSGDISVTLAPEGTAESTVKVPAGATVVLGGADNPPIVLDAVSVAPGAVLPMTISTLDGGSEKVSVPVLDGTQSQYATLVPTASPSTK